MTTINPGDRINIKPEFQDPGDDKYVWTALESPNPTTGLFRVKHTSDDGFGGIMDMYSHMVTVCAS